MKTSIVSIPGYQANEYLLLISPPEDLRNKISHVKKDFSEKFQVSVSSGMRPQLALLRFTQLEMMEERILNRLKTVGMGFRPFKVELKDFGSFPSHTIFINIITREPIRNLVRELRSFQHLMKMDNEHKPHFMEVPGFTIVRRLQPWQYEKGWQEYSQKHFSGRFVADGMLLLKRPVGDLKYQIVQRIEFQNLPVSTRLGDLFDAR